MRRDEDPRMRGFPFALQTMIVVGILVISLVGFVYTLWIGFISPLWLICGGILLGVVGAILGTLRNISFSLPTVGAIILISGIGFLKYLAESYTEEPWQSLAGFQLIYLVLLSFSSLFLLFRLLFRPR